MAYETKVILSLLAKSVGNSKNIREAYEHIVEAANVEGMKLPTYAEFTKAKEKANDEQ